MRLFNLLTENWIPVRRADGSRSRIPPWRITDPDPAIVDIDAQRPDFKGALLELLIGLVQTALPRLPARRRAADLYRRPRHPVGNRLGQCAAPGCLPGVPAARRSDRHPGRGLPLGRPHP